MKKMQNKLVEQPEVVGLEKDSLNEINLCKEFKPTSKSFNSCICEERLEALKREINYILGDLHDLLKSVIWEDRDFMNVLSKGFDEYRERIKSI